MVQRPRPLLGLLSLVVLAIALAYAPTSRAEAAEKGGPFTVGGRLGFGVSFADGAGASFVFNPEVGYALDGENAYLLFDPQVQVGAGGGAFFTLPVSFQYDIELIDGLYLYPRGGIGASFFSEGGNPFFTITPAVGLKYQILPILHVHGEPLRIPLHITDGTFIGQYQFLAGVGVDL
jgi:hypothetical protein